MPPTLALILLAFFCFYAYRIDYESRLTISPALWIPTLWMMRCASRSLSAIFPETYSIDVEGSLPDLVFFSILIVLGLIVLSRRKVNWTELFSSNAWILLLYALMLVSVLWSDTPVISLKRWIRIAGDLILNFYGN